MKYGDYEQGFWGDDEGIYVKRPDGKSMVIQSIKPGSLGCLFHPGDDAEITPIDATFAERVTRLHDAEIVPGMIVEALDGLHKGMCGMVYMNGDITTKGIQFADQFTRSNCSVCIIGHINDVKAGGA